MLRTLLVATLVLAALLAGCASDERGDGAPGPLPRVRDDIVSFRGLDRVDLPTGFGAAAWRMAKTGYNSGEPTLGVASDGTIFTTAGGPSIARSTDDGKSWKLVGTPASAAQTPKTSLDPWIWLDPITDRIYDSPLYVVCTWASWSDTRGDTWDFNPLAGCGVPAHDHQKLTTGPPAAGVTMSGYPNVVYYSYNSFRSVDQCGENCPTAVEEEGGTQVSVSRDGGRSFGRAVMVHPNDLCHAGIASPVMVAPDGTAYSGHPTCDGLSIAVSHDSGATWSDPLLITDVGAAPALAHMVDVATDEANTAYVTWTSEDGAAYLVRSTDSGATWSAPIRVSPPTLNSTVYNVIIAGAAGHVAVGYYGTTADTSSWETADAQSAAADTRWHIHLSVTDDALSEEPTWTTLRLTPEDDPAQIGCIWQSGGSNPCRNLGDFIDLAERDGRPYLVFPDGCDRCSSDAQSRGAAVTVAILETGPSLDGTTLRPLAG
ncbi:MAG TPA: sialidase family protein [Candidatus Thermoplasmatota archaeon]|nr:sialidase family protein [Candidatus Thermoplasmatota archaeon]